MPKPIVWLSFILFFIIVLAPVFIMFIDASLAGGVGKAVLLDARQFGLFKNSILIGIGTVVSAFLIGVPLAFFIARTDLPWKNIFFFLSVLPIFIPSYISTISWIKLLGGSGINFPVKIYGTGGVIFILSLAYFPFVTFLTLTGLYSLDTKLEEAAALMYPKWKVLKYITFPLIFPYIFSGLIFTFIFSVSNYGVPDLLRVNTYPVEIFTQFSAFYNASQATLRALPLVMLTLFLVLLQRYFMGMKSYVTISGYKGAYSQARLGKYKQIAVSFFCCVILFSVIIPIVMLLIGAGSWISYKAAFKTAHKQIINSIVLASISATVISVLSLPIGYVIQRARKISSLFADIISLLPFAVPPTILGIGLIKLWNRPETNFIYKTFLVIIFGNIARFSAFAVRIVSSNISSIHRNLEEAAALVGRNSIKKTCKILYPLTKKGLAYGWIICFALSIGELETTLLVTPAGEATLPIRIYTLMHYGVNKLMFSLCVILIAIIFVPVVIMFLFGKLGGYRRIFLLFKKKQPCEVILER